VTAPAKVPDGLARMIEDAWKIRRRHYMPEPTTICHWRVSSVRYRQMVQLAAAAEPHGALTVEFPDADTVQASRLSLFGIRVLDAGTQEGLDDHLELVVAIRRR